MIRRCCSLRRRGGGTGGGVGRHPVGVYSPPTLRVETAQLHTHTHPGQHVRFPLPTSAVHQRRKGEKKKQLIKLVLLISEDPVWFRYCKSNTVTRAALTLLLKPHLKQQRGFSPTSGQISVGGVRFRPICGINKRRLSGENVRPLPVSSLLCLTAPAS